MSYGYGTYGEGFGAGAARGLIIPAPALALDFLSSEIPDPRIAWAGGGNGTRFSSAGAIVAGAAPRYDYDPTTRAPKGTKVEGAATNLLLNSTIDGASLATQNVAVTAQAYTLSFYGTGSVALSGASSAGPANGAGVFPARQILTFTPAAGTLTLTVTGQVQFAQLETGSVASSYVPTAGAPVTRSAETALISGANFTGFFNQSQGTFLVDYDIDQVGGTSRDIIAANNGATSWTACWVNAGAATFCNTRDTGVDQCSFNTGNTISGKPSRIAFAYQLNNFAGCKDGQSIPTDTAGTAPALDRLNLGGNAAQMLALGGHIRRVSYYSVALAQFLLKRMTA